VRLPWGVPGPPGPPLGYAPDRPRCRVTSLTYPTTQPTHHIANPKPQPNRNKLCCLVIHVVYICLCVSLLPVFWRIKVFINPTPTRGADVWGGEIVGGRVAVACRTSCLQSSSPRAAPGTITHETQSAVSHVHMPTTKCVQEIVNIRRSGAGGRLDTAVFPTRRRVRSPTCGRPDNTRRRRVTSRPYRRHIRRHKLCPCALNSWRQKPA